MPTPWRQNSFAGGELSPSLYGRQDLKQYVEGLRTLRNFVVTPRGSAANRPGTVFCGACKATGDTNPIRLVPFVLDDADTYLLEVGHQYIRFWKNGTNLAFEINAGNKPAGTVLYNGADLQKLKWSQLGSVLYLTLGYGNGGAGYPPQTLTYVSDVSWTLAPLAFDVNQPGYMAPAGLAAGPNILLPVPVGPSTNVVETVNAQQWTWAVTELQQYPDGTIVESAPVVVNLALLLGKGTQWDYQHSYNIGDIVSVGYLPQWFQSLTNGNSGNNPQTSPANWSAFSTNPPVPTQSPVGFPANYFLETTEQIAAPNWVPGTQYVKGQFVSLDNSGRWYVAIGTPPVGASPALYNVFLPDPHTGNYPSNNTWDGPHGPQVISWSSFGIATGGYGQTGAPAWVPIGWRVYRGNNGTNAITNASQGAFGLLGTTTVPYFKDYGATPDYTQPPPQGRNPFKVYAANGNLLRTEYPSVCGFFESRLHLADTINRAWWVWASQVGIFNNFDSHLPGEDDDEYEFQLNSEKYEQIRGFKASTDAVFLASASGLWVMSGSGQGPLTRSNVQARRHSDIGASWNDPLVIGDIALYVENLGLSVNEVAFDLLAEKWRVNDVSAVSRHLFENHAVFDWAFQKKPWPVIWATREDGTLLGLTYQTQQTSQSVQPLPEVKAWGWHDTGPQVALPPTGFPANGATKQAQDFFESVCVVREQAPQMPLLSANGFGTVTLKVSNPPGFLLQNFTPAPTWPAEDAVYFVVRRTINGQTARYIERLATRQVCPLAPLPKALTLVTSLPTPPWPQCFLDCASLFYYPSSNQFSVPQLAGSTVSVWADGNIYSNLQVSALGVLDMSTQFPNQGVDAGDLPLQVVIGLPYLSDLGTLAAASNSAEIRDKRKTPNAVLVEVVQSRGMWAGPDFGIGSNGLSNLLEWVQRKVSDQTNPVALKTGHALIRIESGYQYDGRAVLRQIDPLPLEVTGFTRELDIGGGP